MSQFFTSTMIIENTQLGKIVLLLKGLERNSNMEDEKSIFYFKSVSFTKDTPLCQYPSFQTLAEKIFSVNTPPLQTDHFFQNFEYHFFYSWPR